MIYKNRLARVNKLNSNGQPLIVSNLASIRWLSGFAGSSAICVVDGNGNLNLLSDSRYSDYCKALSSVASGLIKFIEASPSEWGSLIVNLLPGEHPAASFVARDLSVLEFDRLSKNLNLDRADSDIVLQARLRKDSDESAAISAAVSIAEAAFSSTIAHAANLVNNAKVFTEADFARLLDSTMISLGAESPGFDSIVASGKNSIRPHATPTLKPLSSSELIIVDWGAKVDGYSSDTSRTFWFGEINSDQLRLWQVVATALETATELIRPGVSYGEVKRAADAVIAEAGYSEYILHPFGHNVGLDIHERPYFAETGPDAETIMQLDEVVALEPAVYVPGVGGVRHENLLQVKEDGAELFNELPLKVI